MYASTLIWSACAVNKTINHDIDLSELTNVQYFEPFSFIYLIEKGNNGLLNDSLSGMSPLVLDSVIQNNKIMKVTQRIEIPDTALHTKINSEFQYIFQNVWKKKNPDRFKLTPTIDSLLDARNQRFALGAAIEGFARRQGNYGEQIAKSVGVGILTLGMFVPVPEKASLGVYAILMDAKNKPDYILL